MEDGAAGSGGSEPLTAEEQAYDGDIDGDAEAVGSSLNAEGEEETMGDAAIDKSHPGLDVPLEEVDEVKKAAERYARNAAKFDERGFRIMRKEKASFTVGFDMFSEEEQRKREARAAKWGLEPPAEESDAAKEARLQREKRAERFGVPLNDIVEKKQAMKKTDLQTILSMMDKRRKSILKLDEQDQRVDPDPSVEVRPDALHLYGYMPLGTDDFMAAYSQYGATHVEWINGVSLNIVFADNYSASRAIELTSEPLPDPESEEEEAAEGAPAVAEGAAEEEEAVAMSEAPPDLAMFGWRLSNDIVKKKTDKYGRAGETAKMLVRYATVDDLKTYKPRPEGMERPKKRRSSGKRFRDGEAMDLDDGGGGGQKMHELVIREPAEQSKRGKRRRRDNEVEMGVEGDATTGVDAAGELEPSPKFRPGMRGGVVFGEDGTISTVRTCLPDAHPAAVRSPHPLRCSDRCCESTNACSLCVPAMDR